jgi:GtrA-like protein
LWLEPTREVLLLVFYNGVALVLANLNSYVWNALLIFRARAEHDVRQIVLFVLQVLVNIGISSGLFWASIRPFIVYTCLHRRTDASRRKRRKDHLRNGRFYHKLFHHALRRFLAQTLVRRSLVRAPGPC